METTHQAFYLLLIAGVLLLGAEIYVPGGILGTIGSLALIGSIFLAFAAFGPHTGLLVAIAIIMLAGLSIAVWIRFFPRTPVGRKLTLADDGKSFTLQTRAQSIQPGAEGVALTDLRPSGIARIRDQRIDVTAEGGWIEKNTPITVLAARGNYVTVRARETAPAAGADRPA